MKGLGRLLVLAGLAGMFYAASRDTTVDGPLGQRMSNLGLMNDQRNMLEICGVLAIIGAVLAVFGDPESSSKQRPGGPTRPSTPADAIPPSTGPAITRNEPVRVKPTWRASTPHDSSDTPPDATTPPAHQPRGRTSLRRKIGFALIALIVVAGATGLFVFDYRTAQSQLDGDSTRALETSGRTRTPIMLAPTINPGVEHGAWVVDESRDPMTGDRNMSLVLQAEDELPSSLGADQRPALVVRCRRDVFEVYVNTHAAIQPYDGNALVRYRFDGGAPKREVWSLGTDYRATFAYTPVKLAKDVAASHEWIFEFTPLDIVSTSVTFHPAGLEAVLPKALSACHLDALAGGAPTAVTVAQPPPVTTRDSGPSAHLPPLPAIFATIRMIDDGVAARFEPETVTVAPGADVKFLLVSGTHGLAFDRDSIPPSSASRLSMNMPRKFAPLESALLVIVDDSYTLSFSGVSPGDYPFFCARHGARMRGVIRVR